jgi:hypothetical protein
MKDLGGIIISSRTTGILITIHGCQAGKDL